MTIAPGEWLLAIRIRQLGDVLATLGALRALKAHRPERRVAFVVDAGYHELLNGFDFIDMVLPTPPGANEIGAYRRYVKRIRDMNPSAVLDFHGSARSALLTLFSGAPLRAGFDVRFRKRAYTIVEPRAEFEDGRRLKRTSLESALMLARHAGIDDSVADEMPEIRVGDSDLELAARALIDVGVPVDALADGRVVGLNPGRPYPAKEWPRDRFVDLAKRLARSGKSVVIFWGPGEEEAAQAIVAAADDNVWLSPPSSLRSMPALLKALTFLVTIDSGLKHLAVCSRVPTLTLFGSTDPREWHMGGVRDRLLWKGYSCSPCRRLDCDMGAPCMDFSVDEVISAIERTEGAGWIHVRSL